MAGASEHYNVTVTGVDTSGKRYTEGLKIVAARESTDRGHKVSGVVGRLGITTRSLYDWIKRYGDEQALHIQIS